MAKNKKSAKSDVDIKDVREQLENLPEINIKSETDIANLQTMLSDGNNVPIKLVNDRNEISYGVAVPRNYPNPTQYLNSLKEYESSDRSIREQLKLCKTLYIHEGIVGTVLDMLMDLSLPEIKVRNIKNPKLEKAIRYWMSHVNRNNSNISTGIQFANRNFLKDFYVFGNIFPYKKWRKVIVPELKNSYRLPMSLLTIDPQIVDIPPESTIFGQKDIYLNLDRVFSSPLGPGKEKFFSKFPTKIRRQAKNTNMILLDPNEVSHIKRKGSSYSPWGVPYLTRAFNAIASKRKLKHLDDATIDGLINSITIFKIGDKDVPATYKPERLRAFAGLLKNPNPSLTLVWAWDVDVITVSPKGEVLNVTDRYKNVDDDVFYSLGMPISLLSSQGARAGDVWASILFLIERLKEASEAIEIFFRELIEEICLENNFDSEYDIVVNAVRPRINAEFIRNVVLALYDRGLLDPSMVLDEAGFDIEEVMNRRKEEKKKGYDKAIEIPALPFSPSKKNKEDDPEKKDQEGDPTKRTPKDNQKKDTKTVEVDQYQDKIAPKVDGNIKDRIEAIAHRVLGSAKSLDEFKTEFESIAQVIEHIPNLKVDSETIKTLSAEINKIKAKEGIDFSEQIFGVINRHFNF